MDAKTSGWFYVGGGRLRYRDEGDWTEHYLDAESVRGFDGPPPPPAAAGHVTHSDVGAATPPAARRGLGLRFRASRAARRERRSGSLSR